MYFLGGMRRLDLEALHGGWAGHRGSVILVARLFSVVLWHLCPYHSYWKAQLHGDISQFWVVLKNHLRRTALEAAFL